VIPAPPATEVPLADAEGARAGDRAAVEAGTGWSGLLARAGGHLARAVVRAGGGRAYGLRVAIVVGKGDNGGDGWEAACRLALLGAAPWVVAVHGTDVDTSPHSAEARARWRTTGGRTSGGVDDLPAALGWADVVVDCLLGTGAKGDPRGVVADAIEALAAAHAAGTTVVACDVPSGVSVDDGSVGTPAVVADLTVTFGGHARGLWLHPGATHTGSVLVGGLGPTHVVPDVDGRGLRWRGLTAAGAAPAPYRAGADKRARGTVLVVGGQLTMPGAVALAGAAALRAGAGLVTVATPAPPGPVVGTDPGLMTTALPADADGAVAAGAADLLGPRAWDADCVVAGPGLGHGAGAREVVHRLRVTARRLVLDADALNVHREVPGLLAEHAGELVLTPHAGELARIGGGSDAADAWAHRVERVPELAARYRATIVAKGPGTIVAAPDGRVWVTPLSAPALGSGGTGDVLAGVVGAAVAATAGGALAAGAAGVPDLPRAVAQAVWWHALAGVRAGHAAAGRATARDVVDRLPEALVELGERAAVDPAWPFGGRP
jgi:ADP-dependent NAD(P)H-hydrate dehydratase / NAD(P)H-hydrate epimerase